jgi:hypothetical protein
LSQRVNMLPADKARFLGNEPNEEFLG